MTLADVLLSLRIRLMQTMNNDNRQSAEEIFITLSTLRDISYERQDENLTSLIVDLVDSARDIASGVKGKLTILSAEQIQAQFRSATKSS